MDTQVGWGQLTLIQPSDQLSPSKISLCAPLSEIAGTGKDLNLTLISRASEVECLNTTKGLPTKT